MDFLFLEEVDSTNKYAKENFAKLDDFTIIYTNNQTAGRGRLERKWENIGEDNIYASILIKPNCEISNVFSNLTQYLCLILAETFEEYGVKPQIKWPNDILVDNKKICGILLEGKSNTKSSMIVIGIGINVNQITFSDEIDNLTTSLRKELNKYFDIDTLVLELRNQLLSDIEEFLNNNNTFIDYIRNNLYAKNQTITYTKDNKEYEGIILDVYDDGKLIIKKDEEILHINSGEIKIKR